ncbi:MAG: S1C family serine protease [Planctomycetaceae bacterium]
MRWLMPIGVVTVAVAADVVVAEPSSVQPAAPRPRVEQMTPPADEGGRPPAANGKIAYLGIATGPVSDELRTHADLPDRGGLVVTKVAAGSPAEKAGLAANDILLEFDGRAVESPLDLTEMVEAAGQGTRVTLGILRRGRRQEVKAVLTERDEADGLDGRGPGDAAAVPPGLAGLPPALREQLGDVLAEGRGFGQGMIQAQGGGFGSSVQIRTSVVNGVAQRTAIATDDEGTVEIRGKDGRTTVSIRAADGTEVHAGPLDTEADFEKVPEAWRDRVRALDDRAAGKPAGRRGPRGAI